ncbi:MAG: hypothetical protein A2297_05270 [Elusimicrobia bacterium RIFOXYB2_FULL_48_7]|nr:MAG: hypothetical protein A2297_05270 [Elusimicrobia bacterium RIFOXYB2_FULL_48_7]
MRKSYIILILVLLSGLVIPAHCDFDYIGAGARPAGMGNCYTAFSDDAYGIYYNPGGVSFARSMELSTDFGQLWTNLTDGSSLSNGYLGCVYPKGKHAFGLAIQRFSLSGYYSENTVALSYSKKITDTLGLGLNLKQLQQVYSMDEYTSTDEVFANGSLTAKSAISIDPGILWNFYPDYFAGASIINLNQPDTGLAEKEPLPVTLNIGLGYRYNYPSDNFNVGFCVSQTGSENKITSGAEKWFYKGMLAARAGYGFGSRQFSSLSFGAGFRFKQAQVDYSINLPVGGMKETGGTHRISLTYRFTKLSEEDLSLSKNFAEEKQRLVKEYETQIKTLENRIAELDAKLQEAQRAPGVPGALQPAPPQKSEYLRTLEKQMQELQEKLKAQKIQQSFEEQNRKQPSKPVEKPAVKLPAPEEQEAAAQSGPKTHTVKEGESLPELAQKYYNDSSQWKKIYDANKNKIERGQVSPGQVLVIP